MIPRRLLKLLRDCECKIRYHPRKANAATDALSGKERAKTLKAEVEALKKENVKDENLHGMDKKFETLVPMAHHGSRHRHLCQQVLDMFKDEGRLSKAIWFTGKTRNTPSEMGKYSHGFYHKPANDNKLLRHDLGNHDHHKNYADMRRKPLEFQVGSKVMLEVSP
ncbi:hypothetical protein Tco_0787036 [Tanacetum coccineum]